MAPPPGTLRVSRYFLALVVILGVLYTIVFFPSARHTPKLGIDLVGGKRVIFTAVSAKGSPPATSAQMSQARQIIEDRINNTGVTGATVQVQGSDQLIVLIPGGTQADVARLGKAAVLNFRGVMAPAQPVVCSNSASATPSAGASTSPAPGASASTSVTTTQPKSAPSTSAAPKDFRHRPLAAPTPTTTPAKSTAPKSTAHKSTPPKSTSPVAVPSASTSAAAPKCLADPIAALFKTDPGLRAAMPNAESCPSPSFPSGATCRAYSALTPARQQALAAALQSFDCTAAQTEQDTASQYYVACDRSNNVSIAYLLGHVVVAGRQIDTAAAQAPSTGGNGGNIDWTVSLTLGDTGASRWNAWTSKFHTSDTNQSPVQTSATAPCGPTAAVPCSDFVAFTLDGAVISAPVTLAALDRQTSISGNFDQSKAQNLAQELNFGKLPLSFRADANQSVSATLGSSQLNAALLAGGIGLLLVVVYSMLYYRALGLVTIASLLVSAALTYAMLVILGTQLGFTLDLAGIAGFIVALGITADSFVVFFERLKDEVHEGRSVRVAVPRGWVRASRTILSADTVSFLAAAILYYFAAADVKGFAFTLGLSTILDLVVVFLFTHPLVSLLSRSAKFGSARFSGLDALRVGGFDAELPSRSRPAARKRGSSASGAAPATTGTVVLDKATDAEIDADADAGADADLDEDMDPSADMDAGSSADSPVDMDPDVVEPRRRSTPDSSSAAERAAARRARLKSQRDDKDGS